MHNEQAVQNPNGDSLHGKQSTPATAADTPLFSSTEDLLRSLLGRRVALVGNATPTREFGPLIDRYDVVIRMNNFRLEGFEKLVGTRTDFRCTTGHCDIEHRNTHIEFSPFTATAVESAHLAAFNRRNHRLVLTAALDVHPFIPETPKPSTGLALVQLAAHIGLPFDLFGFDGFKTPHYWNPGMKFETTHASVEFEALLQRPNIILFGETYPYAELYNFCHSQHQDYGHNVGLELTRRLQRSFRGRKIIEFGAGNGDLSRHLESLGNEVTAVEVSSEAFAKIGCTRKILGDAFTLAELQDPFDLFASVDVLEHLTENDIRLVLREAGRLADNLYLSVSTRPSGLLGPNGENLHLTVRPADWWVEQVSRYFDVQIADGYASGQIVLEGTRRNDALPPELRSAIPADYCLKPGYQSRPTPEYFEDSVTDDDGIMWQPDVYPIAASIARRLGSRHIIDLGCGRAHKLLSLAPEFEITGIDFGGNIDFCRTHHKTGSWIEANFEEPTPLPATPALPADAVVVCSDVIEHMIRPEALLAKIRHLLDHALIAVISTPERDLTWGVDQAGPPPNPCHTREWNVAEFTQLLRRAGLQVEYTGLTRSHDRDPARKTILAVVSNPRNLHLARFSGDHTPIAASARPEFRRWLAELNGDTASLLAGELDPSPEPIDLPLTSEQPLVSVIVPTYNRPDWLGETLRSILAQTYRHFEIIVVNDAGPDVQHIIEPLNGEGRIRLVTHDRNKGLAAARNTGIRAAKGECIAYLDDDDIFHPTHLEALVAFMKSSGAPVVYSDAHRALQKQDTETGTYTVTSREVLYSSDWDNDRILVHNFVPVLCFMHHRECIEAAGWFDESLTTHEDWDLWIRMSRRFRFAHLSDVTCEFRWRDDGSSMSSKGRSDFLRTADIIYRKYAAMVHGRPELTWRQQQHALEISHALGPVPDKPTPDCLLVSVVIPVFNRLDMTRPCIEAIHRETKPGTFEIIVVDNASTDGTADFLAAEEGAGRLRTIRNAENLGFSKACNQGIRAARGGFILLLNNDTVPLPGWLDALIEDMARDQRIGAAGSCLLYPGGERIQHAGVRIGAGGGKLHPYHPWRLQRLQDVPHAAVSRNCQIVTGACLLLRRATIDQVGQLDEGFINGFEDVDLCFRITKAGHLVRYSAKSRVIHHESMTPGRSLHEQANYNRLNERWKSIIRPDENAETTTLNVFEIGCRERLICEPENPRALGALAEICHARQDLAQSNHFLERLRAVTEGGKAVPISVSIVIPVLNNLALTKQCLQGIERAGGLTETEIIVVDNASTDGTTDYLREQQRQGKLRLIRNATNLGFARACNQGAAMARGRFVLFLNNDTVPLAGWVDAMLLAALRPEVGVVGAKLLYANNTIQHAGIGWMNGLPDHPWRNAPAAAPEVNRFRELDMVTGACFLMPRTLFSELGGFDEVYRNGVEDVDLCLRARAAGRKVAYEPTAVVYHLEGQSAGRFNHVDANLKIFFQRWGKSFDAEHRFITPDAPRVIPAAKSVLLERTDSTAATRPPVVSWEGSFRDHGSLSHVNREITQALLNSPDLHLTRVLTTAAGSDSKSPATADLVTQTPADVDITVRHAWPPNWTRPARGKLVVIQPWEFGALPSAWTKQAADVDEFWAYTDYVRKIYTDAGIPPERVRVVPLGIDPTRFHPEVTPRPLSTGKKFKFLFVGGTIARKGPDLLLKAYLSTFTASDDVCLVIKDFGGNSFYEGQTFAEQIQQAQAQPNAPEILYLNEELAPEELPGLYTACDCLVQPYRGEGFGLPVLEAMACGLPVVVTGGGATDDFATDEFAFRLPSQRRSVGRRIGELDLVAEGWLLEPDSTALAERMRWIVAHPDEARARGKAASNHVRQHWTWSRAAEIAAERVQALHQSALQNASIKRNGPARIPTCATLGNLDAARELFGRQDLPEAWTATVEALQARPFHPEALLLLAEIAAAAHDGNAARECAQRARDLAPRWHAPKKFLQKPIQGTNRPDWLVLPWTADSNQPPRLSVCLITRNEERFLGQCLASIRLLAAQIIVVDTGSTDRTVEIAREHGAEVRTFTWCDDFSAARNAALDHARGDWILILDADEELPREQHAALLKDLQNSKALAYRLPLVNQGQEETRCFVPRLFRNAPGVHFTGRIHEQVFPSLQPSAKSWSMELPFGTARLLHHGYTEEIIRDRRKAERNLHLLQLAVAENPGQPHLLQNLGLELVRSGNLLAGLDRYREAFKLLSDLPPAEVLPEIREGLLTQFTAQLFEAGEHAEILEVLSSRLAKRGGLTASLHYAAGLAHYERKAYREAAEAMRQCLAKRNDSTLAPINSDILTAAPRHCLALCQAELGEPKAAEKSFQEALAEKGATGKVKIDYAKFLARQKRSVEALHLLHEVITADSTDSVAWRLGGRIALNQIEFLEFALDWTGEAIKHLPSSAEIQFQRAQALLLSDKPVEAAPLLESSTYPHPGRLAALVACQIATGATPQLPASTEERAVSQEFLLLYRRLLATKAASFIQAIHGHLDSLESVLPTASRMLRAIASEAEVVPA